MWKKTNSPFEMKHASSLLVLLTLVTLSTSASSADKCEVIFAEQETRLNGIAERLEAEATPTSRGLLEAQLKEAAAIEKQHSHMCFGYYERGLQFKKRLKKLQEVFERASPTAQTEATPAPPPAPPPPDPPPAPGPPAPPAEPPPAAAPKSAAPPMPAASPPPTVAAQQAPPCPTPRCCETKPTERSYPGLSLGFRFELQQRLLLFSEYDYGNYYLPGQPLYAEASLDINPHVSIFGGVGTYVSFSSSKSGESEYSDRVGLLLLDVGLRANFSQPRPRRIHAYIAADFAGAIAIYNEKRKPKPDPDWDDEDYDEKRIKEMMDHWFLGLAIGVEYLVTSEFGIGSELGLRLMINDLDDMSDDSDDEAYIGSLFTTVGIRLNYHF